VTTSPQLTPGCLFVWQDDFDRFFLALAVAVEVHLESKLFCVTYVRDQRIKSVNLFVAECNKRWRVLHAG
jgi:hypothetical protein